MCERPSLSVSEQQTPLSASPPSVVVHCKVGSNRFGQYGFVYSMAYTSVPRLECSGFSRAKQQLRHG